MSLSTVFVTISIFINIIESQRCIDSSSWFYDTSHTGKRPNCPTANVPLDGSDGYAYTTVEIGQHACENYPSCNVLVRFKQSNGDCGISDVDCPWHLYFHSCSNINDITITWVTENRWGFGSSAANSYILTCITAAPTSEPTIIPTIAPTSQPSALPTVQPTVSTINPPIASSASPTINTSAFLASKDKIIPIDAEIDETTTSQPAETYDTEKRLSVENSYYEMEYIIIIIAVGVTAICVCIICLFRWYKLRNTEKTQVEIIHQCQSVERYGSSELVPVTPEFLEKHATNCDDIDDIQNVPNTDNLITNGSDTVDKPVTLKTNDTVHSDDLIIDEIVFEDNTGDSNMMDDEVVNEIDGMTSGQDGDFEVQTDRVQTDACTSK